MDHLTNYLILGLNLSFPECEALFSRISQGEKVAIEWNSLRRSFEEFLSKQGFQYSETRGGLWFIDEGDDSVAVTIIPCGGVYFQLYGNELDRYDIKLHDHHFFYSSSIKTVCQQEWLDNIFKIATILKIISLIAELSVKSGYEHTRGSLWEKDEKCVSVLFSLRNSNPPDVSPFVYINVPDGNENRKRLYLHKRCYIRSCRLYRMG